MAWAASPLRQPCASRFSQRHFLRFPCARAQTQRVPVPGFGHSGRCLAQVQSRWLAWLRWPSVPTLKARLVSVASAGSADSSSPSLSRLPSAPNQSFKPTPLRYSKGVADKSCHAFASTAQVGLTPVLNPSGERRVPCRKSPTCRARFHRLPRQRKSC
jgi:hypothetical protein